MNLSKFTTGIPISVTILCVFLSVVLAFPTPQQPSIQSNLVEPIQEQLPTQKILPTQARLPTQATLPTQTRLQTQATLPTQATLASTRPQITGVLTPASQPAGSSLLSSVIIDILPQISNFTRLLEPRNGVPTSPTQFVNAVTDLTFSFVQAQARDEQREVTQREVDSIILTEAAFNITLELVKDLSQGSNIAFAIKRFTDITPRLARIGAAVEGREITQEELEDLQEANELVRVLTPFFEELSKLNLNAGTFSSVTGNLSNYNVDIIQDYANQNLRNLRDFTKTNFQNFKDYDKLQSPEFSSDRAQEYFENNVHRVQDLTRLGLKNAETLPGRLSPNGDGFGKISRQVAGIINLSDANIKGTQQINLKPHLEEQEFARRTLDVTSFSESLVDRIQRLTNPLSQNSVKTPQTVLRITPNTQNPIHPPNSLQSTSPQRTSQQNIQAKQSIPKPTPIQTAPTATTSSLRQILANQNLAESSTNQNIPRSSPVQTPQTIRQNAPSQTAISSSTRQILANQNLAENPTNQNSPRSSPTQTPQTVRENAPTPTAISSSVGQIFSNQNLAGNPTNQNIPRSSPVQTPKTIKQNVPSSSTTSSSARQIIANQNIAGSTTNQNIVKPTVVQTPQTVIQDALTSTATSLSASQIFANQNSARSSISQNSAFNQNIPRSSPVQTPKTIKQNAPSRSTTSSSTRQILANQNIAGSTTNQNILKSTAVQTPQTVRQDAPTSVSASQIFANQNSAHSSANQNSVFNQQTLTTAARSSNVNQILQNQNIITQINNGNARVIGLVRTNEGMVPLVTIGPHATLG